MLWLQKGSAALLVAYGWPATTPAPAIIDDNNGWGSEASQKWLTEAVAHAPLFLDSHSHEHDLLLQSRWLSDYARRLPQHIVVAEHRWQGDRYIVNIGVFSNTLRLGLIEATTWMVAVGKLLWWRL